MREGEDVGREQKSTVKHLRETLSRKKKKATFTVTHKNIKKKNLQATKNLNFKNWCKTNKVKRSRKKF